MLRKLLIRATIFIGGFGFISAATLFALAYFTVDIPDPNAYVNSQSTIIQYSNGAEIGRVGTQNRQIVPLAKIPLNVRHAVLAAEDRGFYSNRAFSITGIARAIFNNLKGGSLQGGSTITQQYAKTAFLTPSRTIQRKIKELVISIKLENQLSKDQIFESYLNTIYFGRGSYGVMTASQQYFNRNVDQLTNAQAAVIASILRSPGLYDPAFKKGNKERLIARFAYVKNGMVSAGWLSAKDAAKMKFPTVAPRASSGQLSGPKGHVIEAVQKELAKLGFSQDQLLVGGLVIKTTLDQKAQQSAVDAVNKFYPTKAPDNLRIGLVAIKPGTGEIVALYGGRDYLARQLSDATQSIALAGSTFKPFAIVAALEQGIPLSSMWNGDSPQVFDDAGKPYEVSNYGNEGWGQIDLLYATKHSVNTVFVPLGIKVGPVAVVDVARRAGIPESVAMMPTPSVVLGVASPHVIDVANAYATFAAQGIKSKPYLVSQVVGPNKGVLYEAKPETQEVFSKEVMADLTFALKAVVTGGTGAAALALGRPAAGKTGTSQSNASAWFSAYTPQLAASVAFFRDSASESLNGIGGLTSVTGGTFPAKIWTAFMKGALKGEPVMDFPAPSNIGGLDPIVMTSGGKQSRKP
ncbi:MAG: penicillin-binding protein [Actinobacteria bacterium]|uniref:peptidoglycan glycosyltransferase n=1 Tax=freshwater metagenome TaxID=449393 RepID=A0A6J7V6H1_9ZZZZ|nr:penicillin-binding protein [Actinomycetota bacterium]MTA72273.1 penicillin-binding protein [Actinomycetota bacterium]MTB29906.1 penicillin-binding protein [Actinomycetota bacterium]